VHAVVLTTEGSAILIRQFRPGLGEVLRELPGGVIDAADGSPEAAMRRELMEEAGYTAGEAIALGSWPVNPGRYTNRVHALLMLDARRTGAPQPDESEHLEVEEVGFSELLEMALAPATTLQATHALAVLLAAKNLVDRRWRG
jgi:ADP-ribose pyrophosphatase